MKGIAFWFLVLAVASVCIGIVWGIQMSASQNHVLSPAHGHLNLIGWVSFAVFAFYYHLVPEAAQSRLARVHLALAVAGLVLLVPGVALAILERGETLAKLGSVVTLLGFLAFGAVVLRQARAGKGAVALGAA